jgi:FkbM family methyltransferase
MLTFIKSLINRLRPAKQRLSHRKRLGYLRASGVELRRVLDLGAYEGNWTRLLRTIYPAARVVMVDANKDKEIILKRLGESHIAVLADTDGREVEYFKCQNGDAGSGNGIYQENTAFRFAPEKRRCVTLATLLGSDEGFDLIKMDVQGAELDVIRGGLRIVRNSRYLLLELQTHDYNLGAAHFEEVVAFLHGEGFAVIDVVDLMYAGDKLIQADVLFLNKKLP